MKKTMQFKTGFEPSTFAGGAYLPTYIHVNFGTGVTLRLQRCNEKDYHKGGLAFHCCGIAYKVRDISKLDIKSIVRPFRKKGFDVEGDKKQIKERLIAVKEKFKNRNFLELSDFDELMIEAIRRMGFEPKISFDLPKMENGVISDLVEIETWEGSSFWGNFIKDDNGVKFYFTSYCPPPKLQVTHSIELYKIVRIIYE